MNSLERVRTVADAVLYEGYLLYPYRSTSAKNQVRWQFGVLGPAGAADAGHGEEPDLSAQLPVRPTGAEPRLSVHLRFLRLQDRAVERLDGPDAYTRVQELRDGDRTWLSWEEAVEAELLVGPLDLVAGMTQELVRVPGGEDEEPLRAADGTPIGRVLRRRLPLAALVTVAVRPAGAGVLRVEVGVRNTTPGAVGDRAAATAASFLGTHLVLAADGAEFGSVTDPPDWARDVAEGCVQHRCWPVLGGEEGETDVVLASPIILPDHPAVAPESAGALFDATEIDEILTLRVMTLTDEEKAAARATDPHAAAIIDRCDALSPEDLQRLHGALRDPRAFTPLQAEAEPTLDFPTWTTPPDSTVPVADADVPWWDPAADASVRPGEDAVRVAGIDVRRGSMVRLRPNRRADAQDLFLAGQDARVTAVLSDVDGDTHVAVVLVDDPADLGGSLHEWYGRFLYFAPDELEPLQDREMEERS